MTHEQNQSSPLPTLLNVNKTQTPLASPQPKITRDRREDAWLIEIRAGNNKGTLQIFDSGDIVACVTDGKTVKAIACEDLCAAATKETKI